MFPSHASPLPRSVERMRRLRRCLAAVAVCAAAIGALCSLDALIAEIRTPDGSLPIAVGRTALISGKIRLKDGEGQPSFAIRIEPQDGGLVAADVNLHRSLASDSLKWSALLTPKPGASPHYTVTAGPADIPNPLADRWEVSVLSDEAAMRNASPSVTLRLVGLDPLETALAALTLAATTCLLYFCLIYFTAGWLARRGFARVYHTRREGDDTVLYCMDPDAAISDGGLYPVMTASGQALGMAAVISRGLRYCVLRLGAAQARAGCLIVLQLPEERLDI